MSDQPFIPDQLAQIIEDFGYCEGQEKLEYLLEFSEQLPPLPDWLQERSSEMKHVHECITPVFVYGEVKEGLMHYWFDAPAQSPTARGFASMLMQGINDSATPTQVIQIPDNFYMKTGLQKVLSGQRLHGISAFLGYMKQIATTHIAE